MDTTGKIDGTHMMSKIDGMNGAETRGTTRKMEATEAVETMKAVETELKKRNVLRLNNKESNRLTRECLEMALIYLMNEKPFDKITITELVNRSGVSRTAFYRNYAAKEDILREIGQDLADMISELLKKTEYREDPYRWYLECFHVIQDNSQILDLLIHANLSLAMLFENGSIIDALYPSNTYEERYRKLAAEAAFRQILLVWFKDGMKESIEDMAGLCERILAKGKGSLYA